MNGHILNLEQHAEPVKRAPGLQSQKMSRNPRTVSSIMRYADDVVLSEIGKKLSSSVLKGPVDAGTLGSHEFNTSVMFLQTMKYAVELCLTGRVPRHVCRVAVNVNQGDYRYNYPDSPLCHRISDILHRATCTLDKVVKGVVSGVMIKQLARCLVCVDAVDNYPDRVMSEMEYEWVPSVSSVEGIASAIRDILCTHGKDPVSDVVWNKEMSVCVGKDGPSSDCSSIVGTMFVSSTDGGVCIEIAPCNDERAIVGVFTTAALANTETTSYLVNTTDHSVVNVGGLESSGYGNLADMVVDLSSL